jgi:hypothetical protein
MPLYETPNLTGGMDEVIYGVTTEVSIFTPMLLLFVFGVVLVGGLVAQKRRTGLADFPLWTTIASVVTLLVALPLTLTGGLINITTLSIVVILAVVSGVWLFMSKNRYEV